MYRLAYYLTKIPDGKNVLLAQGMNGEIVRIGKGKFNAVLRHLNSKGAPEIEKAKSGLLKRLIIVPKTWTLKQEQNLMKTFFLGGCQAPLDSLWLCLTMRCNFACPYCFQSENPSDMTEEIADRALDYYFKEISKNPPKRFTIILYGGEPLLRQELISHIVKRTKKFCAESGLKGGFSLITNGSLFSEKTAKLFDGTEVEMQTTLDGPREAHDKRRFFKGGAGSYDRIIANLPAMLKIAKRVYVRVNVDSTNAKKVPELLRALKRLNRENLRVYFAAVHGHCGRGEGWENRLTRMSIASLRKTAVGLGLGVIAPGAMRYNLIRCPGSIPKPNCAGADGDLHCCQYFLGKKEMAVGDVWRGLDEEKLKKWKKMSVAGRPACIRCRYALICGGPCMFQFKSTGKPNPWCDPKLFASLLLESIRSGAYAVAVV